MQRGAREMIKERARAKKPETLQYRQEEAEEGCGQCLQSHECVGWYECVLLFIGFCGTGTWGAQQSC